MTDPRPGDRVIVLQALPGAPRDVSGCFGILVSIDGWPIVDLDIDPLPVKGYGPGDPRRWPVQKVALADKTLDEEVVEAMVSIAAAFHRLPR